MLQRLGFNAPNPGWTDDRIARLTHLFVVEGWSASQIAADLGGITRNAVIGKALRLKLVKPHASARATPARAPRPPRQKVTTTRTVHHGNRFTVVTSQVLEPEPMPAETYDVPVEQRCQLVQLDAHRCRWPVGDPQAADFYFCGGSPMEGIPYCVHHGRIAYSAPAPRRPRAAPVPFPR